MSNAVTGQQSIDNNMDNSFYHFDCSDEECVLLLTDDDPSESLVVREQLGTHRFAQLDLDLCTLIGLNGLRVLPEYSAVGRVEDEVYLDHPRRTLVRRDIYNYLGASQHRQLQVQSQGLDHDPGHWHAVLD